MSKETIQLKEAMKILLRDGKNGRLFDAAKTRFLSLYTPERVDAMGVEFAKDVNTVKNIIA